MSRTTASQYVCPTGSYRGTESALLVHCATLFHKGGNLMDNSEIATTVEQKVEDFAEDLGRLLGTAKAKAEGWLGQRNQVRRQLVDIRDTAVQLLSQLADGAS